jgi:hypothetical protein
MQQNISIEIEEIEEESPIFTRYLYVLDDVEYSLYQACIDKKKEEAFFWAYELYYSGFPEIVFSIIKKLIDESSTFDKKIKKQIEKKIDELEKDPSKDEIIAIIVYNVILYRTNIVSNNPIKKRLFVLIDKSKITEYDTINSTNIEKYKARRVLPNVCKYSTIKTSEILGSVRQKWYYNWLYYASFSPIWQKRIHIFGGKQTDEKIAFPNDEKEEEFYQLYGYEPDEQTCGLQSKCIPLSS